MKHLDVGVYMYVYFSKTSWTHFPLNPPVTPSVTWVGQWNWQTMGSTQVHPVSHRHLNMPKHSSNSWPKGNHALMVSVLAWNLRKNTVTNIVKIHIVLSMLKVCSKSSCMGIFIFGHCRKEYNMRLFKLGISCKEISYLNIVIFKLTRKLIAVTPCPSILPSFLFPSFCVNNL